jgi:60 kDa SS-A/Ro ribonucleoprotein
VAYALTAEQALAQFAVTGCFNDTYYTKAEDQLKEVLKHAQACRPEFIAQTAVYARRQGFMKDMPAFLLAHLCVRGAPNREGKPTMHPLVPAIFDKVIDNGKMLRNFVQILRSGVMGRKSMGTAVKRLVVKWLGEQSDYQIFRESVGSSPSLVDVISMVHPTPATPSRAALYGYLRGRPAVGKGDHKGWDPEALPPVVKQYEAYKAKTSTEIPNVPFQMLDSLGLDTAGWTEVARNAGWQMTRMNLNTFKRHGVLDDKKVVKLLAARLSDKAEVEKARVFPYQLLTAYQAASEVPTELQEALQDAMEHAVGNIPDFGDKQIVVCPDVSGSMSSPITGFRGSATTKTTCVDVAALVSAAILRKSKNTLILPFDTAVHSIRLNPRDSVMSIATQIGKFGGGGTACSLPLQKMNAEGTKADLVVYVSDQESWIDSGRRYEGDGTSMEAEWVKFKARNPQAKLMCIDITPHGNAQVKPRKDVLMIGGFSDQVFDLMGLFLQGDADWVKVIQKMD